VKHIMIDLETMGVRPDAAIVSIGAVHFKPVFGEALAKDIQILDEFHVAVSLKSCTDLGLTTDQSTVNWWAKQSSEARSSWQRDDAMPLLEALTSLSQWALFGVSDRDVCPWGNGADFDLVLLKSAYSKLNADPPWRYYNQKCYRTMRTVFPVAEIPRQGTYHNALDDALHQTRTLQQIIRTYQVALP
jgi:exodeoxyribonuclease VIII